MVYFMENPTIKWMRLVMGTPITQETPDKNPMRTHEKLCFLRVHPVSLVTLLFNAGLWATEDWKFGIGDRKNWD